MAAENKMGWAKVIRKANKKGKTLCMAYLIKKRGKVYGFIRCCLPINKLKIIIPSLKELFIKNLLFSLIPTLIVTLLLLKFFGISIKGIKKELNGISNEFQIAISNQDLAKDLHYLFSEIKKRYKSLLNEKEETKKLFNSMPDGIIILDRHGKIEDLNIKAKIILGKEKEDLKGKSLLTAFRIVELKTLCDKFKENKEPKKTEIKIKEENKYYEISLLPIKEDKVLLIFRDITNIKKVARIKSDFVANVSHELKTPLAAILGFVETLKKEEENETHLRFLEIMGRQASRLNRIVEDLLTLSKIELKETRFKSEKIILKDIIRNLFSLFDEKAKGKKIKLLSFIPDDLNPIKGDAYWTEQLFINLIDNAIKFNKEDGKVIIIAKNINKDLVEVKVEDTGIGIPAEHIPRLGERFYRVDKDRSRKEGGTGLGLAISKHIVERQNGKMSISSEIGKGTTVTLLLPS